MIKNFIKIPKLVEEEIVDIVNDKDEVIRSVKRSVMRKKNLLHRATSVITFNDKGEILIHKRTLTKDLYTGYIDIWNGGALSKGEKYDDNAKREVFEEIGVKNPKLIFLFKHKYVNEKNKCFISVYKQIYNGKITPQESEVLWTKFVSIKKLESLIKKEKFCPDGLELFELCKKSKLFGVD